MVRESHGPDRCRSSLSCADFHLPEVELFGSMQHCCCCDTCLYLRPIDFTRGALTENTQNEHCCRCVPRAVILRFDPDDEDDDCCSTRSVWVSFIRRDHIKNPETGKWRLVSVYQTSLFGLDIKLEVGRFEYDSFQLIALESPYVDQGYCAWRLVVTDDSDPYYELTSEAIVDDTTISCLTPPTFAFSVTSPDGCQGQMYFTNIGRAKLAYQERDLSRYGDDFVTICSSACDAAEFATMTQIAVQRNAVTMDTLSATVVPFDKGGTENGRPWFSYDKYKIHWQLSPRRWVMLDTDESEVVAYGGDGECPFGLWDVNNPDEPSSYDDESYPFCVSQVGDLGASCGSCIQVCSWTCWNGRRYRQQPWGERVEAEWFEEWESYGDGWTVSRGWKYDDPWRDQLCYLFLEYEEETGECKLVPDFKDGDEELDEVVIDPDNGCSCKLDEMVTTPIWPVDPNPFGVRVRCGFCGCWDFYCRKCRCVPDEICMLSATDNGLMERSILTWNDSLKAWGTEYGISIHLERDELGRCVLVPYENNVPILFFTPDSVEPENEYLGTWDTLPIVYDCVSDVADAKLAGAEKDPPVFDGTSDTLNANWSAQTGVTEWLYIFVFAPTDACRKGNCLDDAPCVENCGGFPDVVYATLHSTNSYADGVAVPLQYWETHSDPSDLAVTPECGYTGTYAEFGCCFPDWPIVGETSEWGIYTEITLTDPLGKGDILFIDEWLWVYNKWFHSTAWLSPESVVCYPYLVTYEEPDDGWQSNLWGCSNKQSPCYDEMDPYDVRTITVSST